MQSPRKCAALSTRKVPIQLIIDGTFGNTLENILSGEWPDTITAIDFIGRMHLADYCKHIALQIRNSKISG